MSQHGNLDELEYTVTYIHGLPPGLELIRKNGKLELEARSLPNG
jgi:hypothetical protein